jgi:hypothetical protein
VAKRRAAKPNPRSVAAKLGWERRRAAAAKRSAAAKKGWATRRKNTAREELTELLKRPGGKNKKKGKVQPYKIRKYGYVYEGERFDFRGLTRPQKFAMLQLVVNAAVGHYVRMLVVTTDREHALRLYPGSWKQFNLGGKDSGPFWFWTPPAGPMESSLEAYEYLKDFLTGTPPGDLYVVVVEIL